MIPGQLYIKNAQPPLPNISYSSICANTSTTCCLAYTHVAIAILVVAVKNHPFVFGIHIIMHSGMIAGFINIFRDLCKLMDDDSCANTSVSINLGLFFFLLNCLPYLREMEGVMGRTVSCDEDEGGFAKDNWVYGGATTPKTWRQSSSQQLEHCHD